jgi:hypothetical protein
MLHTSGRLTGKDATKRGFSKENLNIKAPAADPNAGAAKSIS